jgi:SAM-dependent methyltransferase
VTHDTHDQAFAKWIEALEARHLADLRVQEVTRALRSLSSLYVERRGALGHGTALDSAGKRAAFAVFYGPLHYLVTRHIVGEVAAADPPIDRVVDLGCGTGAAGAAWAAAPSVVPARPRVLGIDRHPWAVSEARWTYAAFELAGDARQGDAVRARFRARHTAVALAFTVNELPGPSRDVLLARLMRDAGAGARVLVVEPVARSIGSWWDGWSDSFRREGGRDDAWRFEADLPEIVRTLDRAAGLDHRVLTARSLYLAGG